MKPAWTTWPVTSTMAASEGIAVPAGPTASMTPPRTTTTPDSMTRPGATITRPPVKAYALRSGVAARVTNEDARRATMRSARTACFGMTGRDARRHLAPHMRRGGGADWATHVENKPMMRRSLILGTILALGAALATAQPTPPLSPPGTANALIGAKWAKNEQGNMRADGGKWL